MNNTPIAEQDKDGLSEIAAQNPLLTDVNELVANILTDYNSSEILNIQVSSIDELIVYNNKVNGVLNERMIKYYWLENKPEKFLEAFETWTLSKFTWEDEVEAEIMDLLEKKNTSYQALLVENIKRGNFHFPKEILDDLVNIINSWVFNWMNTLYRYYDKQAKLFWKNEALWDTLSYWIPTKDWITWYQDTFDKELIDWELIENINNKYIREYLLKMLELWVVWNIQYKDWINAEISEVENWLSNEQLVVIVLMENYKDKNFIDPDLMILMREKMDKNSKDFWELSSRIYANDYWMDKVNIFLAEPIIVWWDQVYGKFLWKSFPNDMELREKYGNFIIIVKWQIHKAFEEFCPRVAKIFDVSKKELNDNKLAIIDWAIEEVTYHEYWHSVFWVQHQNELEEVKATMFYWTYLFEKYITNNENIEKADIKRIIQSFSLDFTRYLTRFSIPKYRKYIYTAQVLLKKMLDNKLLQYDSDNNILKFVDDENVVENFKEMLIELKTTTNHIKWIYDEKDKPREMIFKKYYNKATLGILDNLHKKL